MRRRLRFAAAVVLFASQLTAMAGAGVNDRQGVNAIVGPASASTIDIGVRTTSDGYSATVGRSTSPLDPCRWVIMSSEDAAATVLSLTGLPPTQAAPTADGGPPPQWVIVLCPSSLSPSGLFAFYPYNVAPPQAAIDLLVASAYDRLALPVLAMNGAPSGDDGAPAIVKLPTWFWVDQGAWNPVSEDATLPTARVVATATPVRTTWDPGTGGDVVVCAGPGAAYDFGRADAGQSTYCSYTYLHSSAVAAGRDWFVLRLTVTWDVSWVCEPACGSGVLPAFQISSSRPVRVAEVQALNTRNR